MRGGSLSRVNTEEIASVSSSGPVVSTQPIVPVMEKESIGGNSAGWRRRRVASRPRDAYPERMRKEGGRKARASARPKAWPCARPTACDEGRSGRLGRASLNRFRLSARHFPT